MTQLFLIQSHKDPDQLARLVRVLRKGCANSIILISHDLRATPLSPSNFGGDPSVHIIEGKGGRGDFTIVDGYLAALRWLKERELEYDWITTLSGQDYPVSSLADFSRELSRTAHDGYLHHFDVLKQDPQQVLPMIWPLKHGYDRYYYQFTTVKESLGATERAALSVPRVALERFTDKFRIITAYGLVVGRRADHVPFTPQFRCYAGSYWHTIRRRCAEYLLEFSETRPDVVGYFRRVLVPDESFVQTVLVNHPTFRFVNDNRRYFELDMPGCRHGHPNVLTADDVQKFANKRYFFARKFEWRNGARLFDQLDGYALSGGSPIETTASLALAHVRDKDALQGRSA